MRVFESERDLDDDSKKEPSGKEGSFGLLFFVCDGFDDWLIVRVKLSTVDLFFVFVNVIPLFFVILSDTDRFDDEIELSIQEFELFIEFVHRDVGGGSAFSAYF